MANTTPLVTTVTKPAINPVEANSTPRVNIQEFCEEHYEDILPIIIEKVRHDRRKDVHTRLDFGEGPRERKVNKTPAHGRGRFKKPWICEEENPFTPRICNFESARKTQMPNNVKTYDGTGDPEDHIKVFQAAAQVERWAMPTWCHMFNSTLIGAARVWFDEISPESIDGYKDLRTAFLAYFMQQKKYVKDPVEIHNIKQREGETIEDFMERFKIETRRMKGAPECMRISGFMHRVNNPELTKRLNEHVPKTMEEMMITTTAFIRGEAVAASKKKGHASWKPQDQSKRHSSDKRPDFQGHPRGKGGLTDLLLSPRRRKKSWLPKQLKKQIEELVRAGKLSHLIKEIKQGRDQSKAGKKDTTVKDKPTSIYMVQSWQRTVKQKVTQSFERVGEIAFPQLAASNGMEGPLVIEAEIDAYKGYHQIQLAEADEEKTAFHIGQGVYCYTKMPFGLKNAGAIYQRLMDKAFEGQVGQNIEAYVDDLVIKSHTKAKMVRDIEETFRTLRKVNMKLNPKKCSFGLAKGVFLGYVITSKGIKPYPDKTAAVRQLPSPQTIKESDFHWTTEAEQAFQQLKQHLSELPLLVAPRPQEELIMYLSATYGAISATLFTDGSSCVDGSGAGFILTNLEGVEFTYALRFQFAASNNEAEYEALVAGLRIATQIGVKHAPFRKGQEGQVPDCRHGLLHEVDRSKGGGNDYRRAEIKMPTYRTAAVDVVNNDEELRLNLDLLEERRERAAVCEARVKSKMMKYYNARFRGVTFKL
nr:reverse transcriptase domain-containing protein [Tanacetum cinerariifolium]